MFIGRENELEKLNDFYRSDKFEMVVIYGRRRVGKTRLLTEFIKGKKSIFYVAEENNDALNRKKFSRVVLDYYHEELNLTFDYWDDLFKYIGSRADDEKLVIVIDELPYMATANLGFMSILQNIIDHHWLNKNIMLVLCGSAISFMENEIVSHKSPLYGRKTGQMKILPLDYLDAGKFFPHYTLEEKFKTYAVLGGIPHYLIQFDPERSLDENITGKVMNPVAFLYDEPNNLLHQELRNPAVYNAIIGAIASGATRINEIATQIGETTAKTNKYVSSLLELEIIRRIQPVDEKKSRKSLYSLRDNLYSFIYRYVYSQRSLIEQDLGEAYYYRSVNDDMSQYCGRIFEEVCLQYLLRKNKKMELPFLVEKFGSWWGNNPVLRRQEEMDIVGLSTQAGLYAECKFRNGKTGIGIYEQLLDRSELVPRKGKYFYLFSKSGFTEELIELAQEKTNLHLLTLGDLYDISA